MRTGVRLVIQPVIQCCVGTLRNRSRDFALISSSIVVTGEERYQVFVLQVQMQLKEVYNQQQKSRLISYCCLLRSQGRLLSWRAALGALIVVYTLLYMIMVSRWRSAYTIHRRHISRTRSPLISPDQSRYQCSYLPRDYDVLYRSVLDRDGCPRGRFVTIWENGRLGNQICQYLTMWVMSCKDVTIRPAWIQPHTASTLHSYFHGIALPTVPSACVNKTDMIDVNVFEYGVNNSASLNSSIVLTDYPCEQYMFSRFRQQVLDQLRWKSDILNSARSSVETLTGPFCSNETCTLIGVHVRRGDYVAKLADSGGVPPASYFLRAFDLCRRRYTRAVFLVVSDDMPWCQQHLSAADVVFAGHEGPLSDGIDMAVLSLCQHSVLSFGTFGQIGSFLNGGDVIIAEVNYTKPWKTLRGRLRRAHVNVTVLPRELYDD